MTEPIIRVLLSQGIIGAIAALFIGLYLREQAEHKAAKTEGSTKALQLLEQGSKALQDAATNAAAETKKLYEQMAALNVAHTTEMQGLYAQISDLRDAHSQRERASLQSLEYFAKQEVEAVEELARIADTMRRVYENRTRR